MLKQRIQLCNWIKTRARDEIIYTKDFIPKLFSCSPINDHINSMKGKIEYISQYLDFGQLVTVT